MKTDSLQVLPIGWDLKTLNDIAVDENGIVDGPFGSNLKVSDYVDDAENGVPVLTTKNLSGNYSKDTVRYVTQEKYDTLKRSTVYPGDILVAKIGSIGKCGIYPVTQKKALIPANLLKITLRANYDRKFVFYYIQSSSFQKLIKSISTATAQPAFNVTKFRKLPIPVPPLEEQRRIVARIEELFSELDAAVATLERTKELLIRYRYSVIDTIIPLDSFISIQDCISDMGQGWSPKCINTNVTDDESWAVIKTTAVQAREFVFEENKKLPETLEPRAQHELVEGDILITRAGPKSRCGVCCMVRKTKKHLLNCDKVYRIKVNEKVVTPQYLECVLNAPKFIEEINLCKTGGNDSGLNLTQKRFLSIKVPIPSLSEQEKIVGEIESRLSVCDKIEETVNTALQEAEAMRQSILKQAFAGEL